MKCQHCGHEVPEGSAFCNHCGHRMTSEITCSYCNQLMPATSVFCPHCGKAVDNAMSIARQEQPVTSLTPQPATTYNEQRAAQRHANAWQQPKPVEPEIDEEEDDDDDDGAPRSNFNRNLIIGIILAALLIGLLSMMKHCNNRENDRDQARADSAAVIADSRLRRALCRHRPR